MKVNALAFICHPYNALILKVIFAALVPTGMEIWLPSKHCWALRRSWNVSQVPGGPAVKDLMYGNFYVQRLILNSVAEETTFIYSSTTNTPLIDQSILSGMFIYEYTQAVTFLYTWDASGSKKSLDRRGLHQHLKAGVPKLLPVGVAWEIQLSVHEECTFKGNRQRRTNL